MALEEHKEPLYFVGMRCLTIVFALLCSYPCTAQKTTDYLTVRSTIVPEACGFRDSSALAEIRNSLEGLDTTTFTENLTVYYSDLALVYYEPTIGSSSTDSAAVQKAASAYRSALFHDPGNTAALWNLVFCCYHLGDCAGVEQYLRRYLAADQRRNWDRKTIRYLRGSCGLHL